MNGWVCFVPLLTGFGTHWTSTARGRGRHAFCVAPQASLLFFFFFLKGPNVCEISSVGFGPIPFGLSGLMTDPGVNRLCWNKWIKW